MFLLNWNLWANIIDVLVVSTLIYWTFMLVKGTRTLYVLIGFIIICFINYVSGVINLMTVNIILGNFLSYSILIVIILFQEDFKKVLVKIGLLSDLFNENERNTKTASSMERAVPEIVKALVDFSTKHRGALIILARNVGLDEYTNHAVKLDAVVSEPLLQSIFHTSSPIHDGAVVIDKGRIFCAGAVLPLTFNPNLDKSYGTRHRAALGISELTDAIVLVVSEETGKISIVRGGRITTDLDERTLTNFLIRLVVIQQPYYKKMLSKPIGVLLKELWKAKIKKEVN
ncbi:MAG: diadenylate cyclase CdaA [Deltaproteobacteria bacterium]|nr:diadenylate cyclase CdaA [Deltaproteobacteria bacterium]